MSIKVEIVAEAVRQAVKEALKPPDLYSRSSGSDSRHGSQGSADSGR